MNKVTVNSPSTEGFKVGDLYHNADNSNIFIVTRNKSGYALVNLESGEMYPYPQEDIISFIKNNKLALLPRNTTVTISTN